MAKIRKPPVRFWIGTMIFLGAFINYTTRINLPISIVAMVRNSKKLITPECKLDNIKKPNHTSILEDYGPRYPWSEELQADIIGSFYWGFTAGCLPSGPIAEWLGPTAVIFWFTLIAAILNALCVPAASLHYSALMVLRFFMGLLGTFAFPSFQVLIAKWAPPLEKGKFSSAMLGNGLSTVINWPIVSTVTSSWGWDWGFYVVSLELLVFCIIFCIICADSPEKHRFISEAEIEYIKTCQGGKVAKKRRNPPCLKIATNKAFWILVICHVGSMWGLNVQMNLMPKYTKEVIGLDLKETGNIEMLMHLFRVFTALSAGVSADWLIKKEFFTLKQMRNYFILFSHFIPGLLTIGLPFCHCNVGAIVFVLLELGFNGAIVVTSLINPQDLAPNFAGTIFGFISFFAAVSGFMVPWIAGLCIKQHSGIKEWGLAFYIGGVIYLWGGVMFILYGSVDEQEFNKTPEE